MTQCNSCCFHYQCSKEQDHKNTHAFISKKYLTKVRRIVWAD